MSRKRDDANSRHDPSTPIEIADDAFVRYDPIKFDSSIAELGLQVRFSVDGYIWMTKFGDIKHVVTASELETILYRQALWSRKRGSFVDGATLWLVKNVLGAIYAGRTNTINGVRQWRISQDIPPSDLTTLRRIE